MKNEIATIFGGDGFLGRHLTLALARAGYTVRVAVRRPNEALFVRTFGRVGQVEPIQANIKDPHSIRRALQDATLVVNAVGIAKNVHKSNLDDIHVEGVKLIVEEARKAKIRKFVQISALSVGLDTRSKYTKTKAHGEQVVLSSFPNALILRPAALFGYGDTFFNALGKYARLSPVMGVVSPQSKLQPVHVLDVAEFMVKALEKNLKGVHLLAGPKVYTMRALYELVCEITQRPRKIINMPKIITKPVALWFYTFERMSFGLYESPISPDILRVLETDTIIKDNKTGFDAVSMAPTRLEPVLEEYLATYRPHGQFEKLSFREN